MTNKSSDKQISHLQWTFDVDCEQYSEDLFRLAELKRSGKFDEQSFSEVLEHISTCQHCSSLMDELVYMLDVEMSEGLSELASLGSVPSLNNRLNSMEAAEVLGPISAQGANEHNIINQGANWIVTQTQSATELLIQLANLSFANQPALNTRGSNSASEREAKPGQVVIDAQGFSKHPDIEVKAILLDDGNEEGLVNLVVETNVPERWPNFSGFVVILQGPTAQAQRQVTGANGLVRFTQIDRTNLDRMALSISIELN